MSTKLIRGRVLTPRRQDLITAYRNRHNWLWVAPAFNKRPTINQWTLAERTAFMAWEDAFGHEPFGYGGERRGRSRAALHDALRRRQDQ